MKAIIPAAGQGTRLYPQTHTRPKPMVRLAGRPILGHILSSVAETEIDEVVVVVGGSMRDQIVDYVETAFGDRFETTFAEQERALGLGHAVLQAEPYVRGDEALVALGDMLFESGYAEYLDRHRALPDCDASVGVTPVEDPTRYGVVEVDDGRVTGLVEKPADPPSNLAISGIYVVEDTGALFDELAHLVAEDLRGAGDEYQLTDALARMVDAGGRLRTFDVEDWYDCGRPETLLEANRVLLERHGEADPDGVTDAVVVPPVDFGDDVTVDQSVVGPHVSLDDGAAVTGSIVRDSIVGTRATLDSVNLRASIVGSDAHVEGGVNELNVGDSSDIVL